jgi:site-specific DNA-methyltransferase (adenine-specific)
MTAQVPFAHVLGCSNLRWLKYEWIWQKERGTGFLHANHAPLKDHENVLIFYDKSPTYHPQFKAGKPYHQVSHVQSANYHHRGLVVCDNPTGRRHPTTVLSFARDHPRQHPTQKPLALFRYLIRTYTNPGDLVVDPFLGSGTTALACHFEGRNCIGGDRTPEYVAMARARIDSVPDPLAA